MKKYNIYTKYIYEIGGSVRLEPLKLNYSNF